jgi:heme exporter protein C
LTVRRHYATIVELRRWRFFPKDLHVDVVSQAWLTSLCVSPGGASAAVAAAAPIGAAFTVIALITGSIWGRPMWGTWWVWDVRVTTETVLLFFYMGYMLLAASFDDLGRADRTTAVLAIVGSVNVPIVKYSVVWWNSLHQGSTVLKFGRPAMDPSMLWPFYVAMIATLLYFGAVLCVRLRSEILRRDRRAQWVSEVL